jgi:hypothetical protein
MTRKKVSTSRISPAAAYLDSLTQRHRPVAEWALDTAASLLSENARGPDDFAWQDVREKDVARLKHALEGKFGGSSVNNVLSAVRRVLREAHRLELISNEDYRCVQHVRGTSRSLPTARHKLADDDVAALFYVCSMDRTASGRRDEVLFLLLCCAGLDGREVASCSLSGETIVDTARCCHAITLTVGDHVRKLVLPSRAYDYVSNWLKTPGAGDGPLICSIDKRGRSQPQRAVSETSIYYIVRRRAAEAHAPAVTIPALKWFYRTNEENAAKQCDIGSDERAAGLVSVLAPPDYSAHEFAARLVRLNLAKQAPNRPG